MKNKSSFVTIKLINFPLNVKEEYVLLNEDEFLSLINNNNIIINNLPYKIKEKRINSNTCELEIVFCD